MSKQRSGQEASQSRVICQVCQVDLSSLKQAKAYCLKKKVCPTHLQADVVYLPGRDAPHRFCHQCGKFEPLDCFDGTRRSCRERTFQRRVKYHNQLHPPAAAAAQSTTSPSIPRRAATAADAAGVHPQDAPAKQQQLPRPLASAVAGAQQAQPSATQLLSHLAAIVGQNTANPVDPARAQAPSARASAAGHGQVPLSQMGRSSWQGAVLGQEQPFLRQLQPQPQLHLQQAQQQFALPRQQLVQQQQRQQQLVQPQLQPPLPRLQQAPPTAVNAPPLQQEVMGLSRREDDAQHYVTVGGISMTGREAQEVVYTLLQRELEKCRQQDDVQLPHFGQQEPQQQGQGQGPGAMLAPLLQPQPTQQQQGAQRFHSPGAANEAQVSPVSALVPGLGGVSVHSPLAASLAMQALNSPVPPAAATLPAAAVAQATESLLQTVQRLQTLLSDPNVGSVNAELITAAASAAAAALSVAEGAGASMQPAQQAQQREAQRGGQFVRVRQDQGLLLQQAQHLLVQEQQQLEEESRRLRAAAYAAPAIAAAAGFGAGPGNDLSLVGPSVPQAMGAHGSAHPPHALRQQQQGQSNPGMSDLIHSLLAALAAQQPGAPLGERAESRAPAAAAAAGLQVAGHGHRTSNQSNPYLPVYPQTAPQQQGALTLPRSLSAVVAMLIGDAAGQQDILGAHQAVLPVGSPTAQQQAQHQQLQSGLSTLSEQLAAAVRASLAESSTGQEASGATYSTHTPAQTHHQQQGADSYAQNVAGAVAGPRGGNDLGSMLGSPRGGNDLGSMLGSTPTQPDNYPDQAYHGVDPRLAERLANALRGSICSDPSAGSTPAAAAVAGGAASLTAAGGMDIDNQPAGCSTGDAAVHTGGAQPVAQTQAVDAGGVPDHNEGRGGQGAPPNAAAAQVLAEIYSVLASMSGPQGSA